VFTRIVSAAGLAGLLCGVLLTALQQLQIAPLILDAERYERAATHPSSTSHEAASPAPGVDAAQPPPGFVRTLQSALANIAVAIGFGLLLASAMSLRTRMGWRAGIAWAAAGYATFFFAPALGLPPRLPGAATAPLVARQLWWAMTVAGTAAGLWLMLLQANRALRLLGAALLIVPHAIGAPQPLSDEHTVPADLEQRFIVATFLANAVFWLALGVATGYFLDTRRRRLAAG
jgi:cobalt transporter subunit CbtA